MAESDDEQRTEEKSNIGIKMTEKEIIKTRNITFQSICLINNFVYLSFCVFDTSNMLYFISSINICCQDERLDTEWSFKI